MVVSLFIRLFLYEEVNRTLAWRALRHTGPDWSRRQESNLRPADYKSAALPTELHRPEAAF
jgi:hypothetical protein